MISHRETGDIGEDLARQHLKSCGYQILDTNWHYGHLELDIVAKDGEELVIVEVKSRNGVRHAHPSEAITNNKIKNIVDAAEAYIFKKDLDLETRFDIITIIFFDNDFELEHYVDAFYPTL